MIQHIAVLEKEPEWQPMISAVAKALAAESATFFDPVSAYVEGEAARRWEKDNPGMDAMIDGPIGHDWAGESWRILARAAIAANSIDAQSVRIAELKRELATARDSALEEAAKVCDVECERILSKQTPNADPLSIQDSINANIRMVAIFLPEASSAIRALQAKRGEDGNA